MKRMMNIHRRSPGTLRWKRWWTKALAWTLVFALLIPAWGLGFAQEDTGGLCVHHPQHTDQCGGETEGTGCGFACGLCVTGWQWNDEEELLVWNGDAALWGLGMPGANAENRVTRELLLQLLPGTVTAETAVGAQTAALVWDVSAVPEEGAYEGAYTLTAELDGEYVLTEAAPALEVLLELGGGETYVPQTPPFSVALNEWEWEDLGKGAAAVITVNTDDIHSAADLVSAIRAIVPNRIYGWAVGDKSVDDGAWTYANKQETKTVNNPDGPGTPDKKMLCSYGYLNVDWSKLGDQLPTLPDLKSDFTIYAPIPPTDTTVTPNRKYFVNDGNNTPNIDKLSIIVHPTSYTKEHTVTPAAPPNVTVNLFDYWVNEQNPTAATGGDILTKNDVHFHEEGGEGAFSSTPTGYSTQTDWNRGINQGHLLLFGDGLIHAGLWNKGAGENCRYGKEYAGMEGIVKNTLPEDGYPELNLAAARMILTEDKNTPAWSAKYSTEQYKLIKDYKLTGDHKNEQTGSGSNEGFTYDSENIQNLSETVIGLWQTATGKTIESGTESLRYLFDPTVVHPNKISYEDVTGLFQLDADGYYYYNMRQNFAEFVGSPGKNNGNNHFVLYDAPATVRTDGEQSIGNFFPFNKGSEVFNGLDANERLTSSIACSRNTMNHHLGMTVTVDFRQPAGGVINTGSGSKHMTFGFSGDDDVWVFVDDVLVLDLGGVHSEIYGTIDFATGDVYIGRAFGVNGVPEHPDDPSIMVTHTTLRAVFEQALGRENLKDSDWSDNKFASNTEHTLKMFYLERGNYDSSIALRFNLQPLLYQQIKKVDQNGEPVRDVEFNLYPAEVVRGQPAQGDIECLYTDSSAHDSETFHVRQSGSEPLVTIKTGGDGTALFRKDGGGLFDFADRGAQYYILQETSAAPGYRLQPIGIVLYYDPGTAMLSVANRWTTGAYACSVSNITGPTGLRYGQFDNGVITPGSDPVPAAEQSGGLVIAVPMLQKRSDGSWRALYGSNLGGFGSVPVSGSGEAAWRKAVLRAAMEQAGTEGAADWHLSWDSGNSRLTGKLSDLPGLADRYQLNNSSGDMRMVYGIISVQALNSLGIASGDADTRYAALREYLKTHTAEEAGNSLEGGFRFLSVNQFNRDFRSLIYIPNEQRELRVLKVDQDGNPLRRVGFGLYTDEACRNQVSYGVTDADGMLIFSPTGQNGTEGQANMVWAGSTNTQYYLKESAPPQGYEPNPTVVPVVVGIYSVYADAGMVGDGVSVMAGAGRLTQTMRQYAMGGDVDITLQDITAVMQVQKSTKDGGVFALDGWQDAKLEETDIPRSMNLHFGKNAIVDYGLHDQDGGLTVQPFFVTDTGFIRARVEQMAEEDLKKYEGENRNKDVNRDDLVGTDLTNLFSLLNIVVVTNRTEDEVRTGQLTVSKKVSGNGLQDKDYTQNFTFTVALTDGQGEPLDGQFQYHFYGKDKWGYISAGGKLILHHDESVTILGLPDGTRFTVTEAAEANWHATPDTEISGTIVKDETAVAAFTNSFDPPNTPPPYRPTPTPTPSPTLAPSDEPTPSEEPETPSEMPSEAPQTPSQPPEMPSEAPETPSVPPETPSAPPDRPNTLPDPNDPDSPEEITIWDGDIPTTYIKVWDEELEEWIYIPEGDVPLWGPPEESPETEETTDNPKTGDDIVFWLLASAVSFAGLAAIIFPRHGKRERK